MNGKCGGMGVHVEEMISVVAGRVDDNCVGNFAERMFSIEKFEQFELKLRYCKTKTIF